MEGPNRTEWLRCLDAIERLVNSSRWRRLAHAPFRYLTATLFNRMIYSSLQRGWVRGASTFFGQPMRVMLPAGQELFLFGAKTHDSELRLARFLLHYLQPGQTMVDVGAHYGFFSLLGAALVGPAGRLIALEASPSTFRLLQYNLSGLPQARALPRAAADHDGELTFYEFPTAYSEYNSSAPEQFAGAGWFGRIPKQAVTVACCRLDRWLSEQGLRPHFIKIDVEGAEAQVISGLKDALTGAAVPLIVMEYLHPDRGNAPHRQAIALLKEYRFELFLIDRNGSLQPCSDPDRHLSDLGLESDNLVLRRAMEPLL